MCFFYNKDRVIFSLSVSDVAGFCLSSASGMFYSPDQTTMFYQLGWSSNTEIAENPHGAIGHRLSATKAYENNVLSLGMAKRTSKTVESLQISFFYTNS